MSQRQWTIEARADCSDGEKEAIKQTVRQLACHLCAQLNLLPTKVRVQVVCFSDDFFSGHEDIAMLEDKLGAALQMNESAAETVSSELMSTVLDMQHDKNNRP